MQIYFYDEFTKEYVGEREALLNPLETKKQGKDVYLIPPFSTFIAPMEAEENKVPVFNTELNTWELTPDYRGQIIYNKRTREAMTYIKLGELPTGYALELPFSMQEAKIEKMKELNLLYEAAVARKVKIGKINACIEDRLRLLEALRGLDEEHTEFYYNTEEEAILLTKEEIIEITEKLYERSLTLPIKKNELISDIKKCKGKNKLDELMARAAEELE